MTQLPKNQQEKFMAMAATWLKGQGVSNADIARKVGVDPSAFSSAISGEGGRKLPKDSFTDILNAFSEFNLKEFYAEFVLSPNENPFSLESIGKVKGDDVIKKILEVETNLKNLYKDLNKEYPASEL